jgi:hypothetical protein
MTPMLLLSAALQLPAAPPPAKVESKPLGPAPRLVLLNLDGDGKVRIQATVTETRKTTMTRVVNGKQETTTVDRDVQRIVDVPVSELEKLTVYTADGKEVNRATALEKLASGGLVVVTSNGEKVDPTYLNAFKDDTLVLVSPQLHGTAVRPVATATGALRAIAVAPALPVPAVAPPPAANPPKDEKKEDKKDDKKDPPKKDEKKN